MTPTDSGEKSFTIGQNIMQNVAIIGQNAAEFIKIMPGMAMTGGATNANSYTATNEGTGNGPVGSFSANGQRTGALDITADGAHIIDPGCNCGQAENTNVEMTSEVTVHDIELWRRFRKGTGDDQHRRQIGRPAVPRRSVHVRPLLLAECQRLAE